MGSTSDPHGVVKQADVVVLTSISEGLPLSVLEALAQQRPVVGTAVGGVLDAMQGAGLTAAPGDVEGLAAGVAMLLEQPEVAEQLGKRGRDRTRRLYNERDCVDGYREVLHLLGGARQEAA
jgi:glycosyltransferase involved in cell wall biosynthesis